MTRYEAGYLQALKDARVTARQMVADTDAPEGKVELLAVVSFLTGLIDAKGRGTAITTRTRRRTRTWRRRHDQPFGFPL